MIYLASATAALCLILTGAYIPAFAVGVLGTFFAVCDDVMTRATEDE